MSARMEAPVSDVGTAPRPAPLRATTVAILAMGGEGGGVLADWIVDVAERDGYVAQTTSVPGVAQRTGATIYYVELFPEAPARAAGKEPVLALMPVPGEVDVVIASELMEAGRAVQRGLVTSDRTTLIASTHRVYSMTERTAVADGRVDAAALIAGAAAAARTFVQGDFARIAEEHGSVISASLFGALAATGALPFGRASCEDAIRRGGVGIDASLAAFAAGYAAAAHAGRATRDEPAATAPAATAPAATAPATIAPAPLPRVGPRLLSVAARVEQSFPPTSHPILLAGVARVADHQDERYAVQYLDRLERVREVDRQTGTGDFALLRETGRYLALWMAYEDASRVADLKIRSDRFARVRQESRVGDSQVLRISEFLHPGIEELTDILPASIGRPLRRTGWIRSAVDRLTRRGTIVTTTSVGGFLQLYAIAALRRWRRHSLRFADEQRQIDAWLALVTEVAGQDYPLALAVAECPRMVKGYGETHHRGRRHFEAVMRALPRLRARADAAACVRRLRDAALADESGDALAAALRELVA